MTSLAKFPPSFLDSVIIPLKLFRFIGIDFLGHGEHQVKNKCKFVIYIIFIYFSYTGGQVLFFIKINEINAGILEIAIGVPCIIICIQSFWRLSLIRKKQQIRSVAYGIAELWPDEFQDREKQELMNNWIRRSNMFCEYLFKFAAISITLYDSLSLFMSFLMGYFDENADYIFPFQIYCPFEIDSLWKYLLVFLMLVVTTITIYLCNYKACDMLLFTLTVDVSMLFRLLQYELMDIKVQHHGPGAEETLEKLKNIVLRHQKLLKLAEKLNEIFGDIMFAVIIFSSATISFVGFLSIVVQETFQRLINLMILLELLLSVFSISLPGQILSDTSSGVAVAAYECLWYNSDIRFRKMINIIIARYLPFFTAHRSQKASKLRAMGYADINFETFYKICGTTWSYFSVMNGMYTKYLEKQ